MNNSIEEVLEINAALQLLEKSKDLDPDMRDIEAIKEACRLIIEYGDRLPKANMLTLETSSVKESGPSISGQTEYGNVSFTDNDENEKPIVKEYGLKKKRVGHYKMWKAARGTICFHHFWKSDITTQAEHDVVITFYIDYDSDSKEFWRFGYMIPRVLFRIWRIQFNGLQKTKII